MPDCLQEETSHKHLSHIEAASRHQTAARNKQSWTSQQARDHVLAMSAQRSAMPAQPQVVLDVPVPPASSSVWDRITSWASDNKAVVYTAGAIVLVVTGAGVAYYVAQPQQPTADVERAPVAGGEKKKSKKERRKAKKHAEDAKKGEMASADGKLISVPELGVSRLADSAVVGSTDPKAPSVQAEDELPEVSETIVAQLSDQVC